MVAIIEDNMTRLIEFCQQYKVARLDVFGSVASGDFDPASSDLDFLVEFDATVNQSRFDNFFQFQQALQKLFGRNIDLVEPGGLKNPYFIESVNQTKRGIYVAS